MKFNWKLLHSSLDSYRKGLGISWRKLGRSHGIPPSNFTRISQGRPVTVQNLLPMLHILGPLPFWEYVNKYKKK